MFLRLLLNLMNPYKRGRMRKKDNLLHQVRLFIYCWIIRCLSVYYTRYAYEDVIDLGHIKVYQSHRDVKFEQWLTQMKIDVRSHLKPTNKIPTKKKSRWWRPFYKFFHLETITSFSHGKYEIVLHRSSDLWMTTNLDGSLELSDDKDIIQRSKFKASLSFLDKQDSAEKSKIRISSSTENKKRKKTSNGIVSLGETRLPFSYSDEIKIDSPTSSVKKIQGAEVDESF